MGNLNFIPTKQLILNGIPSNTTLQSKLKLNFCFHGTIFFFVFNFKIIKIPGKIIKNDGAFCGDCDSRLLPSYKRWYHKGLISINTIDEKRTSRTFKKYKKIFHAYSIYWKNEQELDQIRDKYTLLKVLNFDFFQRKTLFSC